MKIVLIQNGSKTLKGAAKIAITQVLGQSNLDCVLIKTTHPKHAIDIARQNSDDGAEVLIAVGGDGTCNEVINGIQQSVNKEKVLFGIIPNGSGNDFHRMLGEFNPENFIAALTSKKHQPIDLIKIESIEGVVYSLNIAGVGFDGFVVNKLNQIRNKSILKGKTAYAYSILRSFFGYVKPLVQLSSEEYNYNGKMMMTAVCNGTTFGHGLIVSPNAKLNDNQLSITFLGNVSLLDYVKNLSRLKKGVLIEHPEVHYFSTKKLNISLTKNEMFLETDGEIAGSGDFEFSVVPNGIRLLNL